MAACIKYKPLFNFTYMKNLLLAGLLVVCFFLTPFVGKSQQSIGYFPQMDGGYESQTIGPLNSTASSSTPDASFWARGGTSGSGSPSINGAGARTGAKYITVVNTKNNVTTSPRTYLSPAAPVVPSTNYVVQFFCKATDGINFPNTLVVAGVSSATGTTALWDTVSFSATPAVYTKTAVFITSPAVTTNNGFSAIKISSSLTNTGAALDIDDWVVYPGTSLDETAPSDPGTASTLNATASTLDVSWSASADVDGGGYLVVRYLADPISEPNPNVNGIYQVGNSIGNGVVAYVGSSTSFTNVSLATNTNYIYRVYAVDKAFNYSNYVVTSGSTNSTVIVPKFYIDSIAGNDNNNGSITAPWKNVSKLNSTTLAPGTEVYLSCGSTWTGQKLKFNGSGTINSPIKIDKYGTGATPLLAGNGITGEAVVYLYNQQYIEISNLEITNCPTGPTNSDFFVGLYATTGTNPNPLGADRRGVMVALSNFGTANHIYFKNLNIHHIKGQLGSGSTSVNGAIPKRTGGIFFTVLSSENTGSNSRFNDVLIDGCNVNYCENIGISFDNDWNVYYPGGSEYTDWYNRRYSNLKVSNNTVHHIGKNAMIIRCTDETGLIERNVCYETALGTTGNTIFSARAKGTIFQYNEGYNNRSTTQNVDPGNIDGSMYDPDFGSIGVIFQYSYSHDNSEGIYWGCNTRGSNNNTTGIPDPQDTGCTLRYCISQNDKGRLINFNYSSAGNEIYNNVFYTKSGLSPTIIVENDNNNHTYHFYNNIVYNLSGSSSYSWGSGTGVQTRTFSNNVFYGNHPNSEPADPFKITADPKLVNPGSGIASILFLDGYKLQANSPAMAAGKIISNNGGFDFYGTALPSTAPNIGVYQTPVPLPVSLIQFNAYKKRDQVLLEWATQSELNSKQFDIERSNNAKLFTKIGSVNSTNQTAGIANYTFTDVKPLEGINYYRLRMIDQNNQSSTSVVKRVDFSTSPSITIYPNPAKDFINIKIPFETGSSFIGCIRNSKGQIVMDKIQFSKENNSILINEWPAGVYFLKINESYTNKTIFETSFLK